MIKIIVELNDGKIDITSELHEQTVLDVYLVLATIIRDFSYRLNMNPFKLLEEIKVLLSLIEFDKEDEK